MNFIKLTLANGEKIRVNMDNVESYGVVTTKTYEGSDEFVGKTYLVHVGANNDENIYIVNETPDQIDIMIGLD